MGAGAREGRKRQQAGSKVADRKVGQEASENTESSAPKGRKKAEKK